jgi:predicted enzyme related to lactoylglutathione lyase
MPATPLLQKVDAVQVPVPDLDAGLRFYRGCLGHELRWRNDQIGQAGLAMPGSDTEIVLTTGQEYEPNWLVTSADDAAAAVQAAGGRVVTGPSDIPVGPWRSWRIRSATSSCWSICPKAATSRTAWETSPE